MFQFAVTCPTLTDPNNGVMTCSLGDDGVPSYEDTCSFTCNTGYELTGSDTRTCQSNGRWSGSESMCRRGKFMLICVGQLCNNTFFNGLSHIIFTICSQL